MTATTRVEMIPIEKIVIANPRVRAAKIHQEVTSNIGEIGLKRPITVRRLNDGGDDPQYALICGQGRLESLRALGQETIAALIVDADEETGHIMSLVENIARRTPRAQEMLEQVSVLKGKGYSDAEVGRKIGCAASWVNNVNQLLERGESRLLAAAELGHVPISIAVQIAKATDAEAQELLLDAYNRGDLKGNKVVVMRKILDRRAKSGRRDNPTPFGRSGGSRTISPEQLAKLYQKNADEHKRIQRRAENSQATLLVVQKMFKELFADQGFRDLLNAQELTSIPKPLMELAKKAGIRK